VSVQLHAPAALPPRKEPLVPIGQEVGWTPEPVWTTWRRENSWPYQNSNSDPSADQPVASRYTDWAIPAPSEKFYETNIFFSVVSEKFVTFSFWIYNIMRWEDPDWTYCSVLSLHLWHSTKSVCAEFCHYFLLRNIFRENNSFCHQSVWSIPPAIR
jgi:hypothetical protein